MTAELLRVSMPEATGRTWDSEVAGQMLSSLSWVRGRALHGNAQAIRCYRVLAKRLAEHLLCHRANPEASDVAVILHGWLCDDLAVLGERNAHFPGKDVSQHTDIVELYQLVVRLWHGFSALHYRADT